MESSKAPALAAMLIAVISWAAAFPWITIALQVMTPLPLSAIRFVSAGALALIWLLATRTAIPSGRHMLRYLACGFLGSACYSVFANIGQQTVSPGAASFIVNIIPILTALIAWPLLGERLNAMGWLGCLIGFAGVSYIAMGEPGGLSFGAGAMYMILASVCAAIYFVLQKPLVETYGAIPCAAYTLAVSGLFLLPWLPQALTESGAADTRQFLAITGLIVFPTIVSYIGSVYALGKLPAGITTSLLYLIAPFALVFAFLFLGDVPSLHTLAGGALALAGTAIVASRGRVADGRFK